MKNDDDKSNDLLDRWLKEHEIVNKDEYRDNNKKDKNQYKPFEELNPRDYIDHTKVRKFLDGDEDLFKEWLDKHEVYDKDSRESDDSIRLKRAELLSPNHIKLKIDLHGYSVEEALRNLQRFIEDAYKQSEKIVLIIHGKGIHSRQGPIIKRTVSKWLTEGGGKKYIRHTRRAPAKLGGTGATLVWLK